MNAEGNEIFASLFTLSQLEIENLLMGINGTKKMRKENLILMCFFLLNITSGMNGNYVRS